MPQDPLVPVVVMGVQGVGKSTIGSLLARRLHVPFVDGDRLHPPRNIELMSAGIPLQDADRDPWLRRVGETIAAHPDGVVVACSALKREYRDLLRSYAPTLYIVEPSGPIELVRDRISARRHEYMPPELLESQYAALEPLEADEAGIRVGIQQTPAEIVERIEADYRERTEKPHG